MKDIVIRGAREHNLKNIDITLPRDKFIVVTGVSGSGKSTLAFNTLYAEGQRRYVESLSAYARQFLGVMNKPDVDSIDGLSPAISIEQKTTSHNPRSTVGTVTEIYDYLRLLFARIGIPHCPIHKTKIESLTPEQITNRIIEEFKGEITILSPLISQKKGTYEQLLKDLSKDGYLRARVDGKIIRTDEKIKLSRYAKHDIDIVIDRASTDDISRVNQAVENAIKKTKGNLIVSDDSKEKMYSSTMSCSICGISFEELQPRMFSFNSPFGACEECKGLGLKIEFNPDLIIPDKTKSIMDGAIKIYGSMDLSWRSQQLQVVGKKYKFDLFTPINEFSEKQLNILFYGNNNEPIRGRWSSGDDMNFENGWEGIVPQSDRLYRSTDSEYRKQWLERFMREVPCQKCNGKRLKEKVLAVTINDKSIIEVTDMQIVEALNFFQRLKLSDKEREIANLVMKEIISRLKFLEDVGLDYLTLSRTAGTLSGGEAQRIRLATQIGSNLMGVLYILDEPSIGLHQRDNEKLIETLQRLRDLGNTLVVVEHDEDTIRRADYVVDIGPGAGMFGGEVVAFGTPKDIENNDKSITGKYLTGKLSIEVPSNRRKGSGEIVFKGCEENNLKNIDIKIPTGVLTCLTGVSGSGKSTLLNEIIYKGMNAKLNNSSEKPGKHKDIHFNNSNIDKVIVVDQSPIGRTPRSNPATYVKVFDDIRNLFASTKEAQTRGYGPGRFSFNVPGGRCDKCSGDGTIKIEMNFLPDVYIECEECKGKRYNRETLDIKYKDKNISDVLNMSVDESLDLFKSIPSIYRKLKTLNQVGLGYIKLGQSALTLSGGEAQRVKLTKEISKRSTGDTLYLLDEPTTGLHFHDVKKLIEVLYSLVDKGNTMVIIEHNLDVIKSADHIIDLGPEGGNKGGEIIAEGTPEEVSINPKSHTGRFLRNVLRK